MLSRILSKSLSFVPKSVVYSVAKRYIAGEKLDDAIEKVQELNLLGAHATMDVLGEFVEDRNQALEGQRLATHMLDAIRDHKLSSGISVKLTSLGLDIDEEFCYANLHSIVERAKQYNRFVRIDMENSPYTSRTLAIYRHLREAGYSNTGVVLQARLRRSLDDLKSLILIKAEVRVCKGIYVEPTDIAYQGASEIRDNYKRLITLLFENGMHAAIATHDDQLIDFAKEYIAKNSIDKSSYEFQMLLGVREGKRDELIKEGYKVRIYVPFGKDWYGYCVRRLKENPQIAGHVFGAMFKG